MHNLAEKIRALRERSGLSLRDLAQKCGTSKSAVSMYEQGKRRPKYETLEALADIFNVDMAYLLGKSDNAAKEKAPPAVELSADERMLIEAFRALSPEDRALYLALLQRGLGR